MRVPNITTVNEGSEMRAYEIQLFKNNKWEFDSYINDRGTAMAEAERLLATNRHEGVRVIEEEYDPATNRSKCNILLSQKRKPQRYARGPVRGGTGRRKTSSKRAAPRRRRTGGRRPASGKTAARRRPAVSRRKEKAQMGTLSLLWVGIIIVISGIAALIGLQEVAEFL